MTDAPELKPCPFCGSDARYSERTDEDLATHNQVVWKTVGCPEDCAEVSIPDGYEGGTAIERWNTRADLHPVAVKPLKWEPFGDGDFRAKSPFGDFCAYCDEGFGWLVIVDGHDDSWAKYPSSDDGFETEAKAKAECEREYLSRMTPFVNLTPAPEAHGNTEPTGWRDGIEQAVELVENFTNAKHVAQDIKDGYFPEQSPVREAMARAIRQMPLPPSPTQQGDIGNPITALAEDAEKRFKGSMKLLADPEQGETDVRKAAQDPLQILDDECWDLRCVDSPNFDDADIVWEVVSHHMTPPKERIEGCGSTPKAALSAALRALTREGEG